MDIETVCVIDYEVLRGRQNEEVVKEVSLAAESIRNISVAVCLATRII